MFRDCKRNDDVRKELYLFSINKKLIIEKHIELKDNLNKQLNDTIAPPPQSC